MIEKQKAHLVGGRSAFLGLFNLSSNPTFTDENGQIIMSLVDETAKPFTMITGVGLYDANNNLLAVGKLSRPIEKNGEKAINLRLRIDY